MSKYIDAELLRKEIKRLEKAAHKSALGCADSETRKFHEGKDFAYQHVGILIDSLQQEQPEIDLEEEINRFLASEESTTYENAGSYKVAVKDSKKIARHFAQWGAEHAKEEEIPVPNDLEEAARLYAIPHYTKDIDKSHIDEYPYDTGLEAAFIAGAEWQKEQDQPITGNSLEQEWLRYVDREKKEYGGELPSLGEYGWLQIARHFAKWQKDQMLKEAVECDVIVPIYEGNDVWSAEIKIPGRYEIGDKVRIVVCKKED